MYKTKFLDKDGLVHFMLKLKTELGKKIQADENGKVPESLLPTCADDVLEFSGIITDDIEIQQVGIEGAVGTILFSTASKCFVFATQEGLSAKVKYYNIWSTYTYYQDDTFVPYTGKIYVDTSTDKLYRWNGSALVAVSVSLVLGETENTAFAGNRGVALENDVATIKVEIVKKASLDENGKVLTSQLPSYIDGVEEFAEIVSDITITPASTTAENGVVVYDSTTKRFAYGTQDGLSASVTYYCNWSTRDQYADDTLIPYKNKIFVDASTRYTYRWSGSDIVKIEASLKLGYNENDAFPGNEGKTLQTNFDALKASKGEANGLATLDENGKVPESQLSIKKQVVTFNGMVSGVTMLGASTESIDGVVYDNVAKRFCGYKNGGTLLVPTVTYYNNWPTRSEYEDTETDVPYTERIYVDVTDYLPYVWNGTEMKSLSPKTVALTQDEYDALVSSGLVDENTYYNILEDEE